MDQIFESVEKSLVNQNWYAGLCVSMTIPDICSSIEFPLEKSVGKRYSEWFEKYLSGKYTFAFARRPTPTVFLTGKDFYALRCSLLHNGQDDITGQNAQDILSKFHITSTPNIHLTFTNTHTPTEIVSTLQLSVQVFCKDIVDGAKAWLLENAGNADIQARIAGLMKINSSF